MPRQIVRLTEIEMLEGVQAGLTRLYESRRAGRYAHASEKPRCYWHRLVDDTSGAVAERAVAKYLDIPWEERLNVFHAVADVGQGIEVRSSSDDRNVSIIVRDDDPDDRWYVLVDTTQAPAFTLAGMIWGADAKRDLHWANPHGRRGAWFVLPQYQLPVRRHHFTTEHRRIA